MTCNRSSFTLSQATIERLAEPRRIADLSAISERFVTSLRLIALHERAKRDPISELAARLGSVAVAAKALALSQAICATWPEDIHLSRFCCPVLTHDEATIGDFVDRAVQYDQDGFEAAIEGLIRPGRVPLLWDAALGLVAAEARAA